MSCTAVGDDRDGACANCGRGDEGEGGTVKLRYCTACRLVRYCGVDCQRAHRKQHKKTCKQRAAELKDERLRRVVTTTQDGVVATMICGACERELPEGAYSEEQRERRQSTRRCQECVEAGKPLVLMKKGRMRSEEDDCPICNLPQPFDPDQYIFKACCMKKVCNGCRVAALKRGMWDCPFCRTPVPVDEREVLAMVQKRVDAGDPVAMVHLGEKYLDGGYGLEKDVTRAVDLYERSVELGAKEAHFELGLLYDEGEGVEKDTVKAIQHYEAAAVMGDARARHNLGVNEDEAGNYDLALQHYMIAAKLGQVGSLKNIKGLFMDGLATKADYTEALRGHQSAVEEMRSPDREEALPFSNSKFFEWRDSQMH